MFISDIVSFSTTLAVRWDSVHWYILLTVLAAAFIVVFARPKSKGPAEQKLLPGHPSFTGGSAKPSLEVRVTDMGKVIFRRTGYEGLTVSGGVSIAITRIGFDLTVKEREWRGYSNDEPVDTVEFELDFLAADEYYHVHWSSEESGLWTAFTFHVRAGIVTERELRR